MCRALNAKPGPLLASTPKSYGNPLGQGLVASGGQAQWVQPLRLRAFGSQLCLSLLILSWSGELSSVGPPPSTCPRSPKGQEREGGLLNKDSW